MTAVRQVGDDTARLSRLIERPPAWMMAATLLVATAGIGLVAGSVARPIFLTCCLVVGFVAWRQSPQAHLKALITLFCFAPLVRRIIDLHAGYDTNGITLVGPLLTMAAPALLTFSDLTSDRLKHPQLGPVLTVGATIVYAVALSLFQGDWINAASGAVKTLTPLAYAAALMSTRVPPDKLIQAAASSFVVVLPIMGLYGIYQYIDPPEWDRLWMMSATILSAGQPVPYGVRTFSVLNGPASFATFTAAGLLLVLFLRRSPWSLALMLPAAIALLLSMYRTAWVALAAGIVFCLFFRATRDRAAISLAGVAAVVAGTIFTPFGDVILDRLSTLAQGAGDGSVRERLEQFTAMWMRPDSGLIGSGFENVDVGTAGSMAIDGMLMTCWITMGLAVGMICIGALLWAIGNAIAAATYDRRETTIVIGALALGVLTQLPLANIISGELGFLFWTFVIMFPATLAPEPVRRRATGVP